VEVEDAAHAARLPALEGEADDRAEPAVAHRGVLGELGVGAGVVDEHGPPRAERALYDRARDLEGGLAHLGAVEVARGGRAEPARALPARVLARGREEEEAARGARRLDRRVEGGGDEPRRVLLLEEAARALVERLERRALAAATVLVRARGRARALGPGRA